jgi:hypothetical protein
MSMFEDRHYRWRETYFVLFDAAKRPTLAQTKRTLASLGRRFQLKNLRGDAGDRVDSFTLLAPDDFAALDVAYVEGDEVLEQRTQLAEDLKSLVVEPEDRVRLKRIRQCTARFDVLHFEQVVEGEEEEEEEDEMLDPGSMLIVLEALAKLTDGIAVDPQSGTML